MFSQLLIYSFFANQIKKISKQQFWQNRSRKRFVSNDIFECHRESTVLLVNHVKPSKGNLRQMLYKICLIWVICPYAVVNKFYRLNGVVVKRPPRGGRGLRFDPQRLHSLALRFAGLAWRLTSWCQKKWTSNTGYLPRKRRDITETLTNTKLVRIVLFGKHLNYKWSRIHWCAGQI